MASHVAISLARWNSAAPVRCKQEEALPVPGQGSRHSRADHHGRPSAAQSSLPGRRCAPCCNSASCYPSKFRSLAERSRALASTRMTATNDRSLTAHCYDVLELQNSFALPLWSFEALQARIRFFIVRCAGRCGFRLIRGWISAMLRPGPVGPRKAGPALFRPRSR